MWTLKELNVIKSGLLINKLNRKLLLCFQAMFYSTSIFLSAGLTSDEAQQATLVMGVVNVGMTFVSLVLVERAGRKTLMIIGLCVMFVSTIMILVCLVAAVS